MASMQIMDTFSGVGSSIINMGLPIILILFLAVIGVILYSSGILTRYPYKCILRLPRAGGQYQLVVAKGRSVAKGKEKGFEMRMGLFDKVLVSEPKEEYIQNGEVLEGIMASKEEVTWIKHVEVNDAELKLTAAVPENAQLTFAVAHDAAYQRTHQLKMWMQMAPFAALIIAAVILFGGLYVMGNMQKDGMNAYAAAIDRHSNLLENSTIVIYKQGTDSDLGFPNQPTSNRPPG